MKWLFLWWFEGATSVSIMVAMAAFIAVLSFAFYRPRHKYWLPCLIVSAWIVFSSGCAAMQLDYQHRHLLWKLDPAQAQYDLDHEDDPE